MNDFWSKFLTSMAIIFAIIFILHTIFQLELTNTLTLATLIFTIMSVSYSNYKTDKRVDKQLKISEEQFEKQLKQNEKNLKTQLLFDKKQEIYIKLYKDLNDYWELLDQERVTYYIENTDYEPSEYISTEDFSEIHKIVINFNSSPDFLYMPLEIQEVINEFIKYVDNNLEHYDYYCKNDDSLYHSAIDILSKIYPLLKKEIGMKNL